MKKNMFFSLVFALVFSFIFVACDTDRDRDTMNDDDATQLNGTENTDPGMGTDMDDDGTTVTFWDDDREFTYADRQNYRAEVNRSLEKLDAEIAVLERRADNATGDNKEKINERLTELKDKRDAIENRMNNFANVEENNWEEFKDGVNDAWGDIEDSYNQMVRDLDEDEDEDQNL